MNALIPIKPTEPSAYCLGVCCARHYKCARYAAVDGMPGDREAIGTCATREGYPLYQPLWQKSEVAT